jgi:hypothetical protein
VLCAGSTLLLTQTPCHQRHLLALLPKSASKNLRKWFLSPTGRLNLGIITEGKLTIVLIIPSSWCFPTGPVRHQDIFWHRYRGERGFLQGESLTSNLFYFVIILLSLFTLFLFASFYQKYKKKLVPFVVVIFVCLF